MTDALDIGSKPLSPEDLRAVADRLRKVRISKDVHSKIERGRAAVEALVKDSDRPHYSINTGFGSLKNVRIPRDKVDQLQINLIRSHSAGVGAALPRAAVRVMMLLRAHTLALGHSGVRPEVVELLMEMLNHDVVPVVPCQGSVGASGDLAPLAHIALCMIGEGEVEMDGRRMPSKTALDRIPLAPLVPKAKEGLALLNGTQMMTSIGTLALLRAESAMRHADISAAMTLEAMLGTPRAFDERVHNLRPHPGQIAVARNLRLLTADSAIYESHRDCERVQDAYSIRCVPQVHGAGRDALTYVRGVLEREINSVTDNPILLFDGEDNIVSAGNFHGQPVAVATDLMALALTSVASMSERRIFRLLDSELKASLPAGLTSGAGLSSGLMMAQVTAAALVSECKTLAHPASVDSIPTWADQEDHVSMGAFSARKAEQVVEMLERIVAIEMICAAQGLEYRQPLRPAKAVEAAWKALRLKISPLKEDRYLTPDLDAALEAVRSGEILSAVQNVVGDLT